MEPSRRTLLRASALGLTGSVAGFAGVNEPTRQQTTTAEQTTTTEQTGTAFTVQVTTHPEYGVVLTDGAGMTLYLFTQDEGTESTCYDQCAEAWPPLTVEGSANIPDGLPGEFGTTERRDGSRQVTYNGMPLYYFANDEEPGDANGQGVNDVWFVVNPACPGATGQETTTTGETTTEETTTEETTTTEGGDGGGNGDDGNGGDGGGDGGGGVEYDR